jgi:hypothetical protein
MAPINVYDQMLLAGEFLSLALSDLDDLERNFDDAATPDSEDVITDEAFGRLMAFLLECERDAEAIKSYVSSIRYSADRVYHLDEERDRRKSDRTRELLADWRRATAEREEGLPCRT